MRRHPHFKAYLALIAVCFFWGTTYLGIRIALESFPPLVLVSTRFILSGTLMLAGALVAKARLPRGRELFQTALNGVIVLGISNSGLSIAEQWIPSGMAALIITTAPLWMVGVDTLLPGGDRLKRSTIGGILVGGLGAVLLVAPAALGQAGGLRLWGVFLLLQVTNFFWSLGSIRQRRLQCQAHPIVGGAVQQLAAGLACLPFALLQGGLPSHWQMRSGVALIYLMVFGSVVGYSAYVYALDRLPVALASIYTYVNPVVAVFLGWLFYRERFGWPEVAGMAVVFVGVAMVKRSSSASTAVEID